ncbi:MAG: PD40 domain-containing protein [Chloroflexi bacterium]|nr:PD40 domain-containing protein [Chloroflexota bacterium]
MQKTLFVGLLTAMVMASCTSSPNAIPLKTLTPTTTPVSTKVVIPTSMSPTVVTPTQSDDYLIYLATLDYSHDQQKPMYYDPALNVHVPILLNWKIDNISISIKNRLAFSSSNADHKSVYFLDFPFVDTNPINITPDISAEHQVLSWSPNGIYLAIESVRPDGKTLSIWDGKELREIHHYKVDIGDLAWSPDDQLAFTEFYSYVSSYEGDPSEIFIWDGNEIINVSQNASGTDRYPAWSADGQLAFLSEREDEYDLFVWDGKSKNNGMPDIHTFINIAPDLTQYYSEPEWTNSGLLTFSARSPSDSHTQIYEWDGRSASNISNNQPSHNGGQTWRSDGYWAFVTFFSEKQEIHILNNKNQNLLTTSGQYQPAWSQSGLLMFCVNKAPESTGWKLSFWDGTNVREIVQGNLIVAVWRNGSGVFCSND